MNASHSAALIALVGVLACAQGLRPGPQALTFFSEVDDTDQPYALYVPKNMDPAKKYPVVISLHGAGSNHRLNLRRVFGKGNMPGETDTEATRYFPALRDVDFIVASPLARGTMGYQGIAETDVYDVLADVKKRFSVDEDRVYLTGLSMGGGGTLWIGLTRPDVWAAIAPVCPAPPVEALLFAPNALNLPVQFFHGAIDPVVNPDVSRSWVEQLKQLGTKVEYVEYPAVRHNSWDNAYKNGAIFTWFSQFKRDRHPDRVRFVSDRYKYNSAYWVRLDQLTPGTMARIDAQFMAPNKISVATAGLGGFTLSPAGHPKYTPGRPLIVTIDGKPLRALKSLSFAMRNGAWVAAPIAAADLTKGVGREGPIGDALAHHHIYVYGTADNPSPEELAARREIASRAAEWSTPRSRLLLSLRTVADKDVKPSDLERANLVLFGTRETNSLIARFADRLPMALNAGAADYGLIYTFPIGGHYVVVNSGLPWWTGAERLRRTEFRFLPVQPAMAASFGDYALFKGSLEDIVVNGRFDPQWRMPSEDAAKMKATGAVAVR